MLWIIGGTSEARLAEKKLLGKKDFIITVASDAGRECLQSPNVFVGRLSELEMKNFICKNKIDTILDCSHPYALEVSKNAKAASLITGVKYLRVKRPETNIKQEAEIFYTLDALLTKIKSLRGTFLITLGSKNIADLVKVRGENRFIFRVLPTIDSIATLHESGVAMKDIIACLGPFSEEQNFLTIKENKVDYIVTKESGSLGGEDAKLNAAKKAGIAVLLLKRQAEEGEELEILLEHLLHEKN